VYLYCVPDYKCLQIKHQTIITDRAVRNGKWKVKKEKQNKFGNLTKCDAFKRFTSYDMIILAKAIEKNVLRVISELKLTKR
jgi:hypothetical protein